MCATLASAACCREILILSCVFLQQVTNLVTARNQYPEFDLLEPFSVYPSDEYFHKRLIRDISNFSIAQANQSFEFERIHSWNNRTDDTYTRRSFIVKAGQYWDEKDVYGHVYTVNNPYMTMSILEPGGEEGCLTQQRVSLLNSIDSRHCLFAVNAGFFNTTSGACYGNVVSDGRIAHRTGRFQNVHFGITIDELLHVGYVNESDIAAGAYKQLVGGVLWLVRNGSRYVDESKLTECPDVQETGNLQHFIDVRSARSAIGYDSKGRVLIVSVDGQTNRMGMNLYDFADLLVNIGLVNAINLDGGGSATVAEHNVIVNYPSDTCIGNDAISYRCARNISTVICVHEVECTPKHCNNHGLCVRGRCECNDLWTGPACDLLHCALNNCSSHGVCTEGGCQCSAGYHGADCAEVCVTGSYGEQCVGRCQCEHGATCQPVDGYCVCPPGYMGHHCELECPSGFYGIGCQQECTCVDACSCHHVTGDCVNMSQLLAVDQCYWGKINATVSKLTRSSDQYWILSVSLLVVSTVSLLANAVLVYWLCSHRAASRGSRSHDSHSGRDQRTLYRMSASNIVNSDDEDESEEETVTSSFTRR